MNTVNTIAYYLSADWESRLADRLLADNSPLVVRLVGGHTVSAFLSAWYRMGRAAREEKDYGLGEWILRSERSPMLDACLIMFVAGVKGLPWPEALGRLLRPRSRYPSDVRGVDETTMPVQQQPQHLPPPPPGPKATAPGARRRAALKRPRSTRL